MKELIFKIRDKFVAFGLGVAKRFRAFVAFWRAFPRNFVSFWRRFGIGFYNFFRNLPHNLKTMTKDKFIDIAVGTGAVVIWCMPVFVVVYVLTWFLNK